MILIASSFRDTNINHFLSIEIHAIWRALNALDADEFARAGVLLAWHDDAIHDSRWRVDLLRVLAPRGVFFGAPPPPGVARIVTLPEFTWQPLRHLSCPMVSPFRFDFEVAAEDARLFDGLAQRVRSHFLEKLGRREDDGDDDAPIKVLLLTRKDTRVLVDVESGKPLQDVFVELLPPELRAGCRVTSYSGELEEQVVETLDADVVIGVHGAALTNVIFAKPGARVFEVSFRNHWHCDLVCARHRDGTLGLDEKCADVDIAYHKADYRNLCVAFGKRHCEVPALGGGPYVGANPISWGRVLVDARALALGVSPPKPPTGGGRPPQPPCARRIL